MITKEQAQKLFGPKVVDVIERKFHIGIGPCLILEKGTSPEEKREISQKFQEWRHQIFLKSISCKNDEEYYDFIYGRGRFA